MNSIELLPDDIWFSIVPYLSIPDLFSLRLVNKNINQIINSKRVWRELCFQNWLKYDLELRSVDIPNYQKYFFERFRIDNQIIGKLDSLMNLNDSQTKDRTLKEILAYKESSIPILIKLSDKANYSNLIISYYSKNLLNSIRHQVGVKFLHDVINKKSEISDFEEFWFKLSYFDKSFDKLVRYRTKVLDETLRHFRAYETMNKDDTNTTKVLRMYKIFKDVIDKNPYTYKATKTYLEDLFILRVYAGEIKGHSYVIHAILNKLASKMNIKTKITKNLLIIENDTPEGKNSYISLQESTMKVYTEYQVIQIMRSINWVVTEEYQNFFVEITFPALLTYYFDVQRYKSIRTLDLNNVKLFPKSNYGIQQVDFTFISSIYKLFQNQQKEINGLMNFIGESQLKSFLGMHNYFFNYDLIEYFPTLRLDDLQSSFSNYESILRSYNIVKLKEKLQNNNFKVGEMVYNERLNNYSVVIAARPHSVLNIIDENADERLETDIFYTCLTLKKNIEIYREDQLDKIDLTHTSMIKRLVWNFGKFEDLIGFFFKRFDFDDLCFVPREDLSEILLIQ